MNPFFSIIIPTFNRAAFIFKTIDSVLDQYFTDFEIIIVDDGSTDDTSSVVAGFTDERIKYYKKSNEERGAARNFGIERSNGRYVTFLDSDDLLKPYHFSIAKSFLEERGDISIFSLGYDVLEDDGKMIYTVNTLPNPVNEKLQEGNFLSCIGVFVKRHILLENRYNQDRDLSGSEDYELWIRLAARYPIYTLPISTAAIINHESRSVLNFSPDKLLKRRSLLKLYIWQDSAVVSKFLKHKNKIEGYMDLYVALHLAMGMFRRKALANSLYAFVQYPAMLFNYRFWVVLKKIMLN